MFSKEGIRIGTLVNKGQKNPEYIRAILPHGFESFEITFWKTIGDTDLERLAREVAEALAGSGAIVSSLGIFGNPLETQPEDVESLRCWERLIDNAHLFGTDLICGFTGRLRGKPIDASLPRFREVFGELSRRAADRGVRLGFENCDMGGTWQSGDWNIAHTPAAWEKMFDAVPAANIGLEWEPCHQMNHLIDPIPQLRKWAPRVFHVHGKDATVLWDVIREQGVHGPKPFVFHRTPGFGDSNWTDIITILRQNGYTGTIDIEGWHDPVYKGELEMMGQVRGLNYLKACRGGTYVPNPEVG
ncbi:MAG: sugar phosphate isomerase/epimerase [Lentisphaeria bacterium]|nr:sugar phosphate isomerase/epimerase [Lentisphaeria bacterium]